MFAIDVKRRLACNHDLEFRAGSEQLRYNRRGGDKVLEVIEQEKHRLVEPSEILFQAFLRRLTSALANPRRLRDARGDQAWFGNRRQTDKAYTPWKLVGDRSRDMQGKPRLPDAARPGE